MPLLLAVLGCNYLTVEKLAELPIGEGDLVALFPPDGAVRLFGDVPVQVVLGAQAAGTLPSVVLTSEGETRSLPCSLVQSGNVADCGVIPDVPPDHEGLRFEVTAGDEALEATALGRLPESVVGWSLLQGTSFRRLGGNTDILPLVNLSLANASNAFLTLDGYTGEPGPTTLLAGPSGYQEDGGLALATPGLAFVLPVEVEEDGRVHGDARNAWLTLPVNGARVYLLLLDVEVTARLHDAILDDLRLVGNLPAMSVQDLADSLGPSVSAQVQQMVKFDVDRNGDRVLESARVELTGSPAPATLAAWIP